MCLKHHYHIFPPKADPTAANPACPSCLTHLNPSGRSLFSLSCLWKLMGSSKKMQSKTEVISWESDILEASSKMHHQHNKNILSQKGLSQNTTSEVSVSVENNHPKHSRFQNGKLGTHTRSQTFVNILYKIVGSGRLMILMMYRKSVTAVL